MISGEVSSSAVNVILLATAVTSAGRGTRRDTGERTRGRTWVCTDSPLTRTECALVNLSSRKNYPHRAWFLARACLRGQEEGYNVMDRINNKSARCFGDLMDHYEDVTSDQNKLEQDFWYKDVKDLLGPLMPEREEYISIYGRLLVTSGSE